MDKKTARKEKKKRKGREHKEKMMKKKEENDEKPEIKNSRTVEMQNFTAGFYDILAVD